MQTPTHVNLQSLFFPKAPKSLLRAINHALDNPTISQKRLTSMYSVNVNGQVFNPFDILNLGRRGRSHRQWNHDFLMAMVVGYQMGGIQGMQIALMHVWQDFQANLLKQAYGVPKRDLFEAMVNYNFALMNTRRQLLYH